MISLVSINLYDFLHEGLNYLAIYIFFHIFEAKLFNGNTIEALLQKIWKIAWKLVLRGGKVERREIGKEKLLLKQNIVENMAMLWKILKKGGRGTVKGGNILFLFWYQTNKWQPNNPLYAKNQQDSLKIKMWTPSPTSFIPWGNKGN